MADAARRQAAPQGTRLVRYLSDLGVSELEFSHRHLAERLGLWIDFGDAMRLSALQDKVRTLRLDPEAAPVTSPKEEVLRVRLALVQSVVESFGPPSGSSRLMVPTRKGNLSLEQLGEFEPYYRFYAAHQRRFEAAIQTLQLKVRTSLTQTATGLAQLAALDEALRDTLGPATRRCLALIPRLLGKRFESLLEEHRQQQDAGAAVADADRLQAWTRPDGWLGRFLDEMQGLLLAELELRLLPVVGLVEAVTEQAGNL